MLLYPGHTLPTAAAPALVAVALAVHDEVFRPWAAVAAFVAGWLVQLGGVFTDNYANLSRHPDDAEHADLVEAVRTGIIRLGELRLAILACYAVATAAGATLLPAGGVPLLVIGVAAIAASLAYSIGPFPLGDRALGDPLFLLFFGPVSVVGAYYAQATVAAGVPFPIGVPAGTVSLPAIVAGLGIGALTTNILVIDNIRDLECDRSKAEWTVAVLIGRRWSEIEYLALLVVAYAVPFWLAAQGFGPQALLPLASVPWALVVARRVMRAPTRESMQPLTPQAGTVLLAYSVLLAIGLAL
jgi:1,4-dihydroxy-2-naphthoate octaprenyltransferase